MARVRDNEAYEAQRRAILMGAAELFARQGFHQTGIAAICDAVGMSPGGLYRYFGSKAEIIRGIVELERIEALALVDELEAADDLQAGLVTFLMTCAAESRDADGVALSLEVAAEAARDASVGEWVDEIYRQFNARLTQVLVAAQDRGEVAADVDVKAAAVIVAAAANGVAASAPMLEAVSDEALAASFHAMVKGLLRIPDA